MVELLLAGLPATEKTHLGEYLRINKGYKHLDVEARGIDALLGFSEIEAGNLVISWGFVPRQDEQSIFKLKTKGFRLICMDGPRPLVRKHFKKRGTVDLYYLDIQLHKIDNLLDIWSL